MRVCAFVRMGFRELTTTYTTNAYILCAAAKRVKNEILSSRLVSYSTEQ